MTTRHHHCQASIGASGCQRVLIVHNLAFNRTLLTHKHDSVVPHTATSCLIAVHHAMALPDAAPVPKRGFLPQHPPPDMQALAWSEWMLPPHKLLGASHSAAQPPAAAHRPARLLLRSCHCQSSSSRASHTARQRNHIEAGIGRVVVQA